MFLHPLHLLRMPRPLNLLLGRCAIQLRMNVETCAPSLTAQSRRQHLSSVREIFLTSWKAVLSFIRDSSPRGRSTKVSLGRDHGEERREPHPTLKASVLRPLLVGIDNANGRLSQIAQLVVPGRERLIACDEGERNVRFQHHRIVLADGCCRCQKRHQKCRRLPCVSFITPS